MNTIRAKFENIKINKSQKKFILQL